MQPEESQDPAARPAPAYPEGFQGGLMALAMVAAHYRISADPAQLAHELGLAPARPMAMTLCARPNSIKNR